MWTERVGGGGGSGDGGAAGAEVVQRVRPPRQLVSGARPHRGPSSDSLKERNAGEKRDWRRRRSGSTGERFELWDC